MLFWLWKLHVIKQGPNPRPNAESIELPTRNTTLRPKIKKTQCFYILFGASFLGLGPGLWLACCMAGSGPGSMPAAPLMKHSFPSTRNAIF